MRWVFIVNNDMSICITRGDIASFFVTATQDGSAYQFKAGDVVRIKVFGKKDCTNVVLQKDFPVESVADSVEISLTKSETRIGETISKPKDYWYEVELNPNDNPQTIVGYDEDGPKVFKLFPEGKDLEDGPNGGIVEGGGGTGGTVPGLTAEEVQAMIDAALAAKDELTESEVQAMIDAALAAEDELTEEEVQSMINASLGVIANGTY